MIYAMTCADNNYKPVAEFQLKTAIQTGKVDKTLFFCLDEMDKAFKEKNKEILNAGGERRKGCYLWKSYFIHKAISQIQYGDYLIYLDAAGNYYRSKVSETVSFLEKHHIEMIGSRNGRYLEKDWTKRDVFIALDCDTPQYTEQFQCYAGFLMLKKTKRTVEFIEEWYTHCQNYNLITDCPNIMGKDNYEGFSEHRFDQSILSLLMAKEQINIIEELPIPRFFMYHHSMNLSVKDIKRMKRAVIWECIKKHDLYWISFRLKERRDESLWYQRFHQKRLYLRKWKNK